ncbi:hypothetical protein TELCIR_19621, partial [Teladorsagia circumcincta]
MPVPTFKLSSGYEMPMVGLGTWQSKPGERPDSDKMKYSDVDYLTTWKVLEDFVKEGKIRSIGVSNFNHKQIERVRHRAFSTTNVNPAETSEAYSLSNPGSAFFRKAGDPNLLTEPVIKKIASAHNK